MMPIARQDGYSIAQSGRESLMQWMPILLGMLVLYVPSLYSLFTGVWASEEQAHGPIILALSVWLIWRQRDEMLAAASSSGSRAGGWLTLVVGLLLYTFGRSQQILAFEISSMIFVTAGIIWVKLGAKSLRTVWFPFFFMLFMVPLPSAVVSALTLPMKMAVSYVSEHILYWAGYPIARSGVILQIGQYQLLVADACAGLQTLLTLEALGLFYLNVVRHTSGFRNICLALMIIPISFTANVIRVIVLTLVTYHLGDAAGQGFLHGFAGMVLFVSALVLILSVDTMLQMIVKRKRGQS
ncbi:exosortase B [Pseudoduganella lutea]|uniref:Exosortase B n=1 Tax=Pseudoduganella lutea TaxID=321985 RepID=A0A4P6KWG4_9BURK|nr:exosortase B [Pseudoduganella lutea]QBE62528.1 exosortase B [Pseudoduganella lutea]